LVTTDIFSDDARRNPFPLYEQMRRHSPVFLEPRSGLWMLFDYESVKRALSDQEAFSSNPMTANHPAPPWIIFMDPPRHTKLRALIARAFTPRVVGNLETRIRQLSRELLDAQVERGGMDLAADYAVPLPMKVIAELIGIPIADWARFRHWSDVILRLSYVVRGLSDPEEAKAAAAEVAVVMGEIKQYVPALIEQRKAKPQEDLLTGLALAEVDGERLSEEEILGFFQLLVVAGQETTANLINNAILCFLDHPDQFAQIRSQPELLPAAIEEALRYRSPIQWTFRATKCAVEMHGQVIPKNKLLIANMGSANRDGRQFPEPDRFDIKRDPNPHLAFGHGIHFCLGAPLARMEARIALTELMQRLRGLSLASDKPWPPRKALHVHGPTHLPVKFEADKRLVPA
jgi:cytochrome P450